MKRLVAVLLVIALSPNPAQAKAARRAPRAKILVETGRPSSPFECDTAKAREWYGSEERCRNDLCRGGNETSAYVDGPDGRLRRNPCNHRLRE